ncbi:MAG: iron dicitrate transport regulator FecR [Planctomycetes bacterium]|nr:iron dicitrate transport regulator FecR [Planctomycetota bacterium]
MLDESLLTEAAWRLRSAREVVVFSGAGASAESGIPTFRDDAGFWREFPPEQFASWRGLWRTATTQPRRLAEFVHAVVAPIAHAAPNAGHLAAAAMERHVGVRVVTQNIDGLHQEAGSTLVRELHGSLFEIVTREGRFLRLLSRRDLRRMAEKLDRARRGWLPLTRTLAAVRPLLGAGPRGLHRPNLVLFGDAMAEPAWTLAQEECRGCDVLIQVGCSRAVWPAALLPQEAQSHGACVIAIDPHEGDAHICLKGTAATVLPELVERAFRDATK